MTRRNRETLVTSCVITYLITILQCISGCGNNYLEANLIHPGPHGESVYLGCEGPMCNNLCVVNMYPGRKIMDMNDGFLHCYDKFVENEPYLRNVQLVSYTDYRESSWTQQGACYITFAHGTQPEEANNLWVGCMANHLDYLSELNKQ